jgi:hypothetical protein
MLAKDSTNLCAVSLVKSSSEEKVFSIKLKSSNLLVINSFQFSVTKGVHLEELLTLEEDSLTFS